MKIEVKLILFARVFLILILGTFISLDPKTFMKDAADTSWAMGEGVSENCLKDLPINNPQELMRECNGRIRMIASHILKLKSQYPSLAGLSRCQFTRGYLSGQDPVSADEACSSWHMPKFECEGLIEMEVEPPERCCPTLTYSPAHRSQIWGTGLTLAVRLSGMEQAAEDEVNRVIKDYSVVHAFEPFPPTFFRVLIAAGVFLGGLILWKLLNSSSGTDKSVEGQ